MTAPPRSPRVGQRLLAVLLAVLFVGLVAAVLLLGFARLTGDSLKGRVVSYAVVSDSEVVVQVEVAKQPGGTAYCVIRARSADGAEVGRDIAVLDGEGTPARTARGSFSLPTTARPVTGELRGCRAEPISREDVAP